MTDWRGILVRCAVVALVALVAPLPRARACSCMVQEPAAALAAAGAVFEGVLLRHESSPGGNVAVFRVERVWKGEVTETFSVHAPEANSMCPPHLAVGERYIVYADPSEANGLRVRQCARYASGQELRSERTALGRPRRTYPAR